MTTLPQNSSRGTREVFDMLVINGIESVTRALRRGDAFDLDNLQPLARRCRALSDAFEARMKEADMLTEGN